MTLRSALARRRSIVRDDPLPNGLARNRQALETIVRFADEQKILTQHDQAGGDVRGQHVEPGVVRESNYDD
jgi:hypothetical protein